LVDFALRVPVRYKLKHVHRHVRVNENDLRRKKQRLNERGDGKVVLRHALARHVPAGYAHGRKQGFSAPDASWFKGHSNGYIRALLDEKSARLYDYIDPATTRTLLDEHMSGQVNHRLLIWSLLCFEWWLRQFRDNEPVPPRT
jgi:asparagine synthase (glutamine-hydrolysing)